MQECQDGLINILSRLVKCRRNAEFRILAESTEEGFKVGFLLRPEKGKLMGIDVWLHGRSDDEDRYRIERALNAVEESLGMIGVD